MIYKLEIIKIKYKLNFKAIMLYYNSDLSFDYYNIKAIRYLKQTLNDFDEYTFVILEKKQMMILLKILILILINRLIILRFMKDTRTLKIMKNFYT